MNIIQRLSAVQSELAKVGIDKSGKNKQQGYAYRGIDQVMNNLGPLLGKHELLIIPNVTSHKMERGQTKSGGAMYHHEVEVEYFIHGPDGGPIGPFKSRGECIDTADKGLNKACTAAYKYWVLTALCVPLEGHDDADATTPEEVVNDSVLLSDNERHEILGLCMQTNTNVDDFVTWLGYNKLVEVPAIEHARAKSALEKKLEMMSNEYAEGEQGATNE